MNFNSILNTRNIILQKIIIFFVIILCLTINKSYAKTGFIAGPKATSSGDVSMAHSLLVPTKQRLKPITKKNKERIFCTGSENTIGLFGGWMRSKKPKIGIIIEFTHYYSAFNNYDVSKIKGLKKKLQRAFNKGFICGAAKKLFKELEKEKFSQIQTQALEIPLLFKVSVPAFRFFIGPRMRWYYKIKEKSPEYVKFNDVTKKYENLYFDLHMRFNFGLEAWGVEPLFGMEASFVFFPLKRKIPNLRKKELFCHRRWFDLRFVFDISWDIIRLIPKKEKEHYRKLKISKSKGRNYNNVTKKPIKPKEK